MPTPEELDRAAARRTQILKLIRDGWEQRNVPTVQELADATHVSRQRVGQDLQFLAAEGFVERVAGAGRTIRLTDKALKAIEGLEGGQ